MLETGGLAGERELEGERAGCRWWRCQFAGERSRPLFDRWRCRAAVRPHQSQTSGICAAIEQQLGDVVVVVIERDHQRSDAFRSRHIHIGARAISASTQS